MGLAPYIRDRPCFAPPFPLSAPPAPHPSLRGDLHPSPPSPLRLLQANPPAASPAYAAAPAAQSLGQIAGHGQMAGLGQMAGQMAGQQMAGQMAGQQMAGQGPSPVHTLQQALQAQVQKH